MVRQDTYDPALEAVLKADLENVVSLFDQFISGTHKAAWRFDLVALTAKKRRVEGAIQFVSRISAAQG